jgi:hypothetical protein
METYMRHVLPRATACLALLLPIWAFAGQPVEVAIYDRTAGRELPVYWQNGDRHVAGEPGHEYEIRVLNRGHSRLLAVTSVDGVNVITGRAAAPDQSGYVIDARGRLEIDGWRKSMDQVAAFYFTSLGDSYAARTGRPDHVGVIGIAVFREQVRRPLSLAPAPAAAPAERDSGARARDGLRSEERLGTGHGQRLDSGASYTRFERATEEPEAVIRIYYDSRRNLLARGIIPAPPHRHAGRLPDPFPAAFVPDP